MAKKLTRRKKLIIGVAVPLLVLVIVACVFLFGGKKGTPPVKPEDSISICLTPPSSGAPNEYGGLENIGYIAGKLRMQPHYHSEMNGSVDAMVTQEVHGYKDYKDGVYIASSISIAHSSLAPSKALQKFFGDGKAVIRTAASDDSDDWNGIKTKWATGAPNEILTREQYEEKYGMWGNELTDYIINSETLLSCSTPQKGADGIYTMTAELDPVKSTYYYKHQMITMGELGTYPEFESIRLTFRFREDWTLLSYDIYEKYETYVSVITAECEAKMTITYSYDESKVDVSAYENYFKKYANAAPVVLPEPEKGAREYLTAAFGPLLGGEKCIDFTANINENIVAGKIALDISLEEGIAFNGLQLNLGNLQAGLVGKDIVLQYKDFNGKFPLEELLSYLGVGATAAEMPAIDADALLGDLMNAPIIKDGDKSSISATLALGDFPIHIAFQFREGTEIALEKIEASLELEGMPVSLTAILGEKTGFVELDVDNAIDVSPFVQDILPIIMGKNYAISVKYANADFAIAGEVVLNANSGIAVGADITISVNGGEIPVNVVYKDETVYVSCKGLQVKGTLDEISGLIARFVPQTTSEVAIDTATLVDALLKTNFDKLLKSLSLTENSVGIVVDGNELLGVLETIVGEVEFELGDITLGYSSVEKAFRASVLGVEIGMTATETIVAVPENADTYVSVTEIAQFIDPIMALTKAQNVAFSGALKTEIEGVSLGVSLSGYVTLGEEISLYVQADVTVNDYVERLEILYKEGGITVVYGGTALVVPESEISLIAETLTKVLGGQESALMVLTEESVYIVAILESVKLYSESEGLGAFVKLSTLLDMDISDLTASLSVKENMLTVKTNSLSMEGFAVQDVQISIGAVETVIEPDFAEVSVCTNVLEFALSAYRAFADSEYVGLDVVFASEEMKLSLDGVVQFKAEEGSTASIINMDVGVAIETYAYNEESGANEVKETHYVHVTILNEQLWASYSLKEMDAPTAVYVTLPISELFVAGGNVLPILAPMLGISEDIYYYDFVVKILSGAYKSFTTDIIDTMTLGEWLSLIEGIVAEQGMKVALAEEVSEETESTQESSFAWSKDENGDTMVAINAKDVAVSLSLLKNAAPQIVAPSAPEGKSYLDISSIATLLTDVLNAYDYKDDGYALSGTLALSVGSLPLKNMHLDLQIQVMEKIALYARLEPKSGTVTQLTIEDGYVYMTRVVQSTETKIEGWKIVKYNVTTTEYRTMTMAQFSEDMMEQIYFILNLSSTEKWIIDSAMKNAGSSGGDTTSSQYDAGDMVKGFVYTPESEKEKANYEVTLNLGAILNDSAFGDVKAKITREQIAGKDYYDLTKIDATVGISVLSCNLSLTHDSAKDPSKLDLSKIGTHKAEVLSGLEYTDFDALYAAVENGMVSKSSQVRVKA